MPWPGTGRRWIRRKNVDELYSVDPETNCWNWKGVLVKVRGKIYPRYKLQYARPLLYERKFGKLPEDASLWVGCENWLCVNPDHVVLKERKNGAGI